MEQYSVRKQMKESKALKVNPSRPMTIHESQPHHGRRSHLGIRLGVSGAGGGGRFLYLLDGGGLLGHGGGGGCGVLLGGRHGGEGGGFGENDGVDWQGT